MENTEITVSELQKPVMVKEYLRSIGFSLTLIKRVKFGGILLNGDTVTVRALVKNGDQLKIIFPEHENESIIPMDIPLSIIYEDDYILAVDKPTNMPTHPSRGNNLPTLANAIIGRYGKKFVFRSINRLDRDTSGIVLIAKDPISAHKLSSDMKSGRFHKQYICTVYGEVKENHGYIDAPIRREAEGSIKRIVAADGKHALTEYEVLSRNVNTSICKITLHTGRTHQIRVHMSHIGHPLVGDFLYGKRESGNYQLRCTELSFPHPVSDKIINLSVK